MTTQMTTTNTEIDSAFHRFDKDNDNSIDVHELHQALEKLGMPPDSFQHTLEVMRRYDKDRSGTLQLKEFRKLAREMTQQQEQAEAIFYRFDTNKSGRMSNRELFTALQALGLATTSEDADEVMKLFSAEKSKKGTLRLVEFRKAVDRCRVFQTHCAAFRRHDANRSGTIDVNELFTALAEEGLITSQAQAGEVLMHFADSSQSLGLPEYIRLADAIAVFKQFDVDVNGHIDAHELHHALQALRVAPSFEQTQGIMKNFDKDGDSNLQLNEYLALVRELYKTSNYVHTAYCNGTCGGLCNPVGNQQSQQKKPQQKKPHNCGVDQVEAAFRRADQNSSGSISVHELHGGLEALGIPPNNFFQTLENLQHHDKNRDGTLNLAEFRVLAAETVRQLQETDTNFAASDVDRDGRITAAEFH